MLMSCLNKQKIWTLPLVLVAFLVVLLSLSARADECRGCLSLKKIEKKYQELKPKQDDKVSVLIVLEATKAVQNLPKNAEGLWSRSQVAEIVELLRLDYEHDSVDAIIDGNLESFKENRVEISKQLHKIPIEEAKNITNRIRIVMHEEAFGNDPGAIKPSPTAKPLPGATPNNVHN
jgi:uncharacterized protein YeeX (DUF496 family)